MFTVFNNLIWTFVSVFTIKIQIEYFSDNPTYQRLPLPLNVKYIPTQSFKLFKDVLSTSHSLFSK